MIYLSVEGLTKQYTDQLLFKDLKFSLSKGHKVGLIAKNGAGKTTLLRILAGQDTPDYGNVYLGNNVKLGYLEQEPQMDDTMSIRALIDTSHRALLTVIQTYEQTLKTQTKDYTKQSQKAFELASAEMDAVNAWDYQRRLEQLLTKFNISDLGQAVGSLSGGEKKRLAMALILLDDPGLLILDEPTNHLDVEMIEWLEKYLSKSSVTLLMVTHDRYFLDRICNHIIELDEGNMYHHQGNYGYYLEKKAEREAVLQTEIGKAEKLLKKELEWIRRSPKARTTKSKSRIDAFHLIKQKALTKTVKDELRLEAKLSRVGGKILEMKQVTKSYGSNVIMEDFSHTFKKGARIGVVGRNGVGKSTFLNMISGREFPDSGEVDLGTTTVFGYYSQKGLVLKEDKRIIDILTDIAEVITLGNGNQLTASQFLQYFLFPAKMQRTFYSRLSGGEKRRLYLLTILIKNPNFLIMDEPTNDLDLLTLNKLEEFLERFQGCLILVSHDRYFMDQLVDELLVFEGDGKVKSITGTYSAYREAQAAIPKSTKEVTTKKSQETSVKPRQSPKKKKLTFKEKQEYEKVEQEIEGLEQEKIELNQILAQGESDYTRLQETTTRLARVMRLIDEKTLRWMELDELT
jgi:ATP-binding cassette subfamily F protein uup